MKICDARILYVDDEPMLLKLFAAWLTGEDEPKSISTAADGQEALEMLQKYTYDLLITDVKMPRMDGISLVRCFAQSGKTLPAIIFASGFGNVDEREMYGLGVEAFISKPLTRETLIRAAENALADRSSLWSERFETLPRQSIAIEALDFCKNVQEDCIVLGRGGFSGPYRAPVAPGKVSFDCHLSAIESRFAGQGYVRWRSKIDGTLGIELVFLEESCRSAMAELITKQDPRAFIPST